MRSLFFLLLLILPALAHPVAQGSLDLDITAGEVRAVARISNEQVFVQAANAQPEPENIQAAWRAHGDYLLAKMQVEADGQKLTGTVENVTIPTDHSVRGFTAYTLRFPLAATPKVLRLQQSLMNEISYAPGNPWEATLIVSVRSSGQLVRTNALFTHREPLQVEMTASAHPPSVSFGEFFWHGAHHIIEGWDHLLFMAALVLAVRRVGELLAVVTAFTVAHTITLTLSVLDVVRLSPSIVEPMIAASIVVVAVQNIWRPSQSRGRLRLALAFGFGLFHGLGFAGGLLETMQGGESVGRALLAFSLGVEVGHQVVVLPIFLGLFAIRRWWVKVDRRDLFTVRVVRIGSVAIALAGCFYLVSALRSGGEEEASQQAALPHPTIPV